MSELSPNQRYHLILADISMVASITSSGGEVTHADREDYSPGSIRDRWLARTPDSMQRRSILALANAAMASLKLMPEEQLAAAANKYGIPFAAETAENISTHFDQKREAVLLYNR